MPSVAISECFPAVQVVFVVAQAVAVFAAVQVVSAAVPIFVVFAMKSMILLRLTSFAL